MAGDRGGDLQHRVAVDRLGPRVDHGPRDLGAATLAPAVGIAASSAHQGVEDAQADAEVLRRGGTLGRVLNHPQAGELRDRRLGSCRTGELGDLGDRPRRRDAGRPARGEARLEGVAATGRDVVRRARLLQGIVHLCLVEARDVHHAPKRVGGDVQTIVAFALPRRGDSRGVALQF